MRSGASAAGKHLVLRLLVFASAALCTEHSVSCCAVRRRSVFLHVLLVRSYTAALGFMGSSALNPRVLSVTGVCRPVWAFDSREVAKLAERPGLKGTQFPGGWFSVQVLGQQRMFRFGLVFAKPNATKKTPPAS